ncbi:MAG: NUDIX domain-containing protein [Candidatus Thorarchaeota archaeon]|nr:MAG: NUDIX domain-containing protein [Candidatus Thorarchaeota archaeon]
MNDRRYPQHPIPGVGAIVVGRKGILLARRDKHPGEGFWSIPGGGVEIGENQKESVFREVLEETGIECEVLDLVSTDDLITLDDTGVVEFHFLLNHYLARALTEDTRPEFPNGEVAWFHPDKLPEDMVNQEIIDLLNSVKDSIFELMNQ